MHRALLAVCALSAAALLLSACGGSRHLTVVVGPLPVRITPPSPTALRFSTASNRRFAHSDVRKLLRILELPRDARLVARVPRSAPLRYRDALTRTRFLPGIAVAHRVWVIHEPLDRVVRFVQVHAHPRPRPMARFRGENYGVRLHPVGSYEFPPVPGRSWQRWLNVDMVALSGGGTAVIAQTSDGWIHAPRSPVLPRGVKRIDVVSKDGNGSPNVLVHVRRAYDVGSIVALVNGSGLANAEHIGCLGGLAGGPTVTLRFRAASGKLLARATVAGTLGNGGSGPCNPMQLTVHARKAPPLINADLLLRIKQLLGVDLAPPLPRDVGACLQRHGWKVLDRGQNHPPKLTAAKDGRRWTITFHYSGKVTLDKAGPRELDHCLHTRPRYVILG